MRLSHYLHYLCPELDSPTATGPVPMRVDPRDLERDESPPRTDEPEIPAACPACGAPTYRYWSRSAVCLGCGWATAPRGV